MPIPNSQGSQSVKSKKKIENYWMGSILRCKNERHGEKSAEKMAFIFGINGHAYARTSTHTITHKYPEKYFEKQKSVNAHQ